MHLQQYLSYYYFMFQILSIIRREGYSWLEKVLMKIKTCINASGLYFNIVPYLTYHINEHFSSIYIFINALYKEY